MKIDDSLINRNRETIFQRFSFSATTSQARRFSSLLEFIETPTVASYIPRTSLTPSPIIMVPFPYRSSFLKISFLPSPELPPMSLSSPIPKLIPTWFTVCEESPDNIYTSFLSVPSIYLTTDFASGRKLLALSKYSTNDGIWSKVSSRAVLP